MNKSRKIFFLFSLMFFSSSHGSEIKVDDLFDNDFYEKAYNIPKEEGLNHYLTKGHYEGLRPNPWFNKKHHLGEVDKENKTPLLHLLVEKINQSLEKALHQEWDFTIVGAGFAGCTLANRLANAGFKVALFEKKPYIGGNCCDWYDANGVLIHPYGPHIFHTNNKNVLEFLSNFTQWRFYEHRVRSVINAKEGTAYPMPINRTTINMLYGLNLETDEQCQSYYDSVKIPIEKEAIKNSEDVVYSLVGKDLCDKFFRNYTKKQWERDLKDLDPSVLRRIPTRTNTDDRYFTDTYQFIPAQGYSSMFHQMVEVNNLNLFLGIDYLKIKKDIKTKHIINTGPVDAFFDYQFGALPYRSIRFEFEHHPKKQYQKAATMNYPNDYEFTRITEFKHITGQDVDTTTILKEYPKETSADQEPYYPILCEENDQKLEAYEKEAKEQGITLLGRLAEYKYYNMDQAVEAALKKAEELKETFKHLLPKKTDQ
jgi:UDP-galactopyranose mutase